MRKLSKIFNLVLTASLIFIALAVVYVAFPQFGNQALIVRSGSMEPTIAVGSIVVVRPTSEQTYKKGEIIAFRSENSRNTIITHRVSSFEKDKDGFFYKTKGDANEEVDSWQVREKNVIGKVSFIIPYAGQFLAFVKSKLGFLVMIVIPALVVILLEAWNIFREVRKRKNETSFGFRLYSSNSPRKFKPIGFKIAVAIAILSLIAIPGAYAFLADTETSSNNLIQAANVFPSPSSAPSVSPTVTPTPTIEPSITP